MARRSSVGGVAAWVTSAYGFDPRVGGTLFRGSLRLAAGKGKHPAVGHGRSEAPSELPQWVAPFVQVTTFIPVPRSNLSVAGNSEGSGGVETTDPLP